MTFDYTRGQKANYMVSFYNWNLHDRCYFHTYAEAKKFFDKSRELDEGTYVSLYDLNKDVRKAYKQC